jgi:hypothetical protein
VDRGNDGAFKKSTTGLAMLMIVKPTYLLLVDSERTKLYDRIELASVEKWGLSKGKTTCLIIKTEKDELKIFAADEIQVIEDIISEYVTRIAGKKVTEPNEKLLIKQ